jgi:hypothetical protein
MSACAQYFQGLIDYLSAETDEDRYLSAIIAGNRHENNPFALYIYAAPIRYSPPAIISGRWIPGYFWGEGDEFFSDRVRAREDLLPQPFDAGRAEIIRIHFTVPNGPLSFIGEHDNLVAQFSAVECTDSGLVVCTSDFDRSIVLVSFRKEVGLIVQPA